MVFVDIGDEIIVVFWIEMLLMVSGFMFEGVLIDVSNFVV